MKYLGPYGFLLLTSLILLLSYYLLSWKLYPDIHKQVFSLLWELTKSDIRFIFIPFDVVVYYLGITLLVVILIAGTLKAGSVIYNRLKEIKERRKRESENLKKLRKLLPKKLYLLAEKHKDLVLKVAERFGKLPASKSHHHSEKYGLLKHSLETALKLVEKKEQISAALGVDEKTAERIAVILGLFHDIGKVYPEVPFKYQNALVGYEMGKLGVDLHPPILAKVLYAITVEHSDFAKLENPLIAILTTADRESVKENTEERFLIELKNQILNFKTEWNNPNFFKVIVNPSKNEVLVNLNVIKEVYSGLNIKEPLMAILENLAKKGIVIPSLNGNLIETFWIADKFKIPAVVFNLKSLNLPTTDNLPVVSYIPNTLVSLREKLLKILEKVITSVNLQDESSPILSYRDSKGKEWILIKASALEFLREKGLNVNSLKELASVTGFEVKQIKKINTKALRVPAELLKVSKKLS